MSKKLFIVPVIICIFIWSIALLPIWIFHRYELNCWFAMFLTTVVSTGALYNIWWILWDNVPKPYIAPIAFVVMLTLIGLYTWYVPGEDIKNKEVKSEYYTLHPLLRLSLGPIGLIDKKMMLTDISRKGDDYESMGLPKNSRSLHYVQEDGYSYAMDFRTRDRSDIRNWFTEMYFKSIGLYTLRHNGTADHLHVHLEPNFERTVK